MDSVKQSAALCLLCLYKTSPDLVPMGESTSRVVHLLNDQYMDAHQFGFNIRKAMNDILVLFQVNKKVSATAGQ